MSYFGLRKALNYGKVSIFRFCSTFPKHKKITMPALSPTMSEGNLVKWNKTTGDQVKVGDVLAQIETDKATMDFEVMEDGFIAKIFKLEGETDIPVGEPLCIIVSSKDNIASFENYVSSNTTNGLPESKTIENEKPNNDSTKCSSSNSTQKQSNESKIVFSSPLAKKKALELKVDLSKIKGSGPNGRIVERDVSSSMTDLSCKTTQPTEEMSLEFIDINVSSLRKIIATRLLESKNTIPHYYLSSEINLDNLMKIRQELNSVEKDFKLSINDFIVKASSLSCQDVPECNSSWMGSFIRQYTNVDISIAVNSEKGLITPIVQSANLKGLKKISKQIKDLAERAKQSKLAPHEYQGGTFTISNLGMYGIDQFCAIINPPQSCILAVGAATRKVLVDHQQNYFVGNTMKVTLSCDHRVVDGATGAKWLQSFKNYIEDPIKMLL